MTLSLIHIFSGFINGKLVDSLIIGIIALVCCNLFRFPYPMLLAVIIGVTNIIPFFGPFIGAIPCALLILLVSPLKCLYFVIFIFVLQQFDGNILGPKILGDSTGLASFWVLFSILLFGGLFGFVGMVLGVPVFAMFYSVVSRLVRRGLKKRGLPLETEQYLGCLLYTSHGGAPRQRGLPGLLFQARAGPGAGLAAPRRGDPRQYDGRDPAHRGRLPVRHHPRAAGGAPETAGVGPEGGSHERDPDPYQRMRSGIYVSFQGIFY